MESQSSDTKPSLNRENQCRLCLKTSKTRINFSRILRKMFLDVTQLELLIADNLSDFLCPRCVSSLKSAHAYREKLIATQNLLMSEISSKFMPELINVKLEKMEVDEVVTEEIDGLENEDVKDEVDHLNDFGLELHAIEALNEICDLDQTFELQKNVKTEDIRPKRVKKVVNLVCGHDGCNGASFKTKRLYNAHMKIHKVPVKKKSTVKPAMCSYCGLVLHSKYSCQKHIDGVHIKTPKYFCDICGYSAPIRESIRSHIKTHLDVSERKKYKCDICDYESICLSMVRFHKEDEHEGIVHSCYCGKTFKTRTALYSHTNVVHLKIKKFECDCGKKFYSSQDLNHHKTLVHNKNKVFQFSCEHCGKQFYTRKQMYAHKSFHAGLSFPCEHPGCGKVYNLGSKLAMHAKIHSGVREVQCHLCDKAYFFNKDLKMHLNVAHKQIIFHCELCSYTNSRKDYLRNHIRSVHPHVNKDERMEMSRRAKFTKNQV